ncbi:MAG: alanyl-tRNA editing protein [Acutalibacteraceae bacterium]
MTEKLYDTDSYLSNFECKVISLDSDDRFLYVETDRTAFFPEGGGQTSDRGILGNCHVENVQIIGGKILHFVEKSEENADKLKIGDILTGKIDMKKRFSDMQQHSGEHIFSGIVNKIYGYNNVGFHLGSNAVTMDFDGVLEEEDICKVENLVNKAIWDNLKIRVTFPSKEELEQITYRSKIEIEGQVRLVEIPGIDICACCAPHVSRTGEIGILRVVAFEHYKGGTRVNILCGERALLDLRHKLKQNRLVSHLTSSKQDETAAAVERLKDENEKLKYDLVGLTRKLIQAKVDAVPPAKRIVCFDESLTGSLLQDCALSLREKSEEFAACFSGADGSYRYCIVGSGVDLRELNKALTATFHGRGGGRKEIIQGSLTGEKADIECLIKEW